MFISGFDKSDQKEIEEKHLESEDPETGYAELAEIIEVVVQKILILKQNFSLASKNIKKQNISQITSRFR